jgi:adhesin/invasin
MLPANGQLTTDATGVATLTSWTLGTTPGTETLVASATGLTSVTFHATATVGPPATLAITGGNSQSATVNTAVVTAPSARVTDASGNPVAGVVVTFTPGGGSGSVVPANGQVATDATGVATLTSWTLGTAAGAQSIAASASGTATPVTFSATATPGAAATLAVNAGNNQSATVNTAVATAPSAKVTDAFGNPVAGVIVTFTPSAGSTSPVSHQATSDAAGVASLTSWTLGNTAGAQSLVAATPGATNVTFNATATSGTADHITALTATTLIGTATVGTTQLPASPQVTVVDAFANAVSGATVLWTLNPPCASGITLQSASTSSNGSGIATVGVTVPSNVPGSCQVVATLSGGNAVAFSAIMKPAGAAAWTAATNQDYNTAANWDSGLVPTTSTPVFIPAVVLGPTLSANGVAAGVTLEAGTVANIALNTRTLTVSGDVTSNSAGISNGTLVIDAASPTTIRGTLPATVIGNATSCGSGSYSLAAAMTATALTLDCPLDVGANALTVSGNFATATTNGLLKMTTVGGAVTVNGTSTFAGASESGQLTNGTFTAKGGFSQQNTVSPTSFLASGSHLTVISGTQSVSFANPSSASAFNDLSVTGNGSTATFTTVLPVNRDFTITSSVGAAQATFNQTANVGGNLTANANTKLVLSGHAIVVAGTVAASATADLGSVDSLRVTGTTFPAYNNTTAGKAPRLTDIATAVTMTTARTVAGALSVTGSLDLNGLSLTVKDSLNVAGQVKMLSATPNLTVQGNLKIAGGTFTAAAAAGTLTVGGNFTEAGSGVSGFAPASGFTTTFNGTSAQSISFNNPGTARSYFQALSVTNTSSSGVTFSTDGVVKGALLLASNGVLKTSGGVVLTAMSTVQGNSGSKISQVAELVDSATTFPTFNGTNTPALVRIAHAMTLTADATLTGSLIVSQGLLDVNTHKLTVLGDFTVDAAGLLRVATASDSVVVGGNAEFKGDQQDFPFTAGAFDFKGNFKASGANSFYVGSSANTARFTGTSGPQTIDMTGASNSFAKLAISRAVSPGVSATNSNVSLSSTSLTVDSLMDIHAGGSFNVPGGNTLTLSGLSPALNFHSGSSMTVSGTVAPSGLVCQRDNSGTAPSMSGTGTFADQFPIIAGSGAGTTIFTRCGAASLP